MPFEHKRLDEDDLITYEHTEGLKGVLNGVDAMAKKLKANADEFDGHVSELQKSSFYKYMKDKQSNIIG